MQYNYNTRQLQYNNTIKLQYNTLTLQYNYNTIELQYNFEQDYSTFCNRCGNGPIHPQGEPFFTSNTTALIGNDVQTA